MVWTVVRIRTLNRDEKATLFLLGVVLLLLIRITYLQTFRHEKYEGILKGVGVRYVKIPASRGMITDRNGVVLASDEPSFQLLWVGQRSSEISPQILHTSSSITGIPEQRLQQLLQDDSIPPYMPIVLQQDVSVERATRILSRQEDAPYLKVEAFPIRRYHEGESFSHILGYLGEVSAEELENLEEKGYIPGDWLGKAGIEKSYEEVLRGKVGYVKMEVSPAGYPRKVLQQVEPTAGESLVLTVDARIQKAAAEALQGRAGAVILADVHSGEILALVSSPSYDSNAFVRDSLLDQRLKYLTSPANPMVNRGIAALYPPGSTFKIVTATAALAEGLATPQTSFYCPGFLRVGNRNFHCWKEEGHGTLSLIPAIGFSCDVYFYQLGLRVGADRLTAYAKKMGFGDVTGVELYGEKKGLFPTPAWKKATLNQPWFPGDTANLAIGQGFLLVTPIQMLQMMMIVANGGTLPPLHLVKALGGKELEYNRRKEIFPDAPWLETLKAGLRHAVTSGTARAGFFSNFVVYGKTGTAESVGKKPYSWFVAVLEKGERKVAAVAVVEGGGHGASTAVPLLRQVFLQILPYF